MVGHLRFAVAFCALALLAVPSVTLKVSKGVRMNEAHARVRINSMIESAGFKTHNYMRVFHKSLILSKDGFDVGNISYG